MKLSNFSSTKLTPEWLQAYKIIDLYYAAGLLLFTVIRLLPGHEGLHVIASLTLTSTVLIFVIADLWSLHYRSRTFLSNALIPLVTISFACIGIWSVNPYAVMWVFASIPVLFVRLSLPSAYALSLAGVGTALGVLFFKYSLDSVTLARLALSLIHISEPTRPY